MYAYILGLPKVTGHTALMEVAKAGAMKLLRAILQRGGNLNTLDNEGLSAAHFAAERGLLEVCHDIVRSMTLINILGRCR